MRPRNVLSHHLPVAVVVELRIRRICGSICQYTLRLNDDDDPLGYWVGLEFKGNTFCWCSENSTHAYEILPSFFFASALQITTKWYVFYYELRKKTNFWIPSLLRYFISQLYIRSFRYYQEWVVICVIILIAEIQMQILGHFFGRNFLNHSLSDDNHGKWRKFLYSFYNLSVVDDYGGLWWYHWTRTVTVIMLQAPRRSMVTLGIKFKLLLVHIVNFIKCLLLTVL